MHDSDKFGVVGLGNISLRHRRVLKTLFPKNMIIGVSSSGRNLDSNNMYLDRLCADITELIHECPKAVIVCSPASHHAVHAVPLIEAGIPVLIEKPICTSSKDFDLLKESERLSGTKIAVGYCMSYLPVLKNLKLLLREELIGKIYNVVIEAGQYLPDWRPTIDMMESVSSRKDLGGGVVNELSHEIQYTQSLFGELKTNYAKLRENVELGLEVEETCDCIFTTNEQAIIYMHLDFLQKVPKRNIMINGASGNINVNLLENSITLNDEHGSKLLFKGKAKDWQDMYSDMIIDFFCFLDNQRNHCISLEMSGSVLSTILDIKNKRSTV